MTNLKCPNCNSNLEVIIEPDIEYEKCPHCLGIFLDDSKIKHINAYLQNTTKTGEAEEFRDYVNGILVRVDIVEGSSSITTSRASVVTGYTQQNNLVITVYYKSPLKIDLLATPENFLFRLAKLIIKDRFLESMTGDTAFNNYFKIHTIDEEQLNRFFNRNLTSKIMDFINARPSAYNIHGKITLYDDKIVYREGPYTDTPRYRKNDKFDVIINNLVEIAKQIK